MNKYNKDLIYISCDSGKSSMKYAWLNQNDEIMADSFATIVEEVAADVMEVGSADKITVVTKKGEALLKNHYLVGGVEGDIAHDKSNSKLELKHEVSILTAVARVLATNLNLDLNNEINVSLSVNVPLDEFKVGATKQEYMNRYGDRKVEVILNGKTVKFKITNIDMFFESQGALIRNLQLVNREDELSRIHIIDVGSKNDTQISFTNKLSPVPGANTMNTNGINRTVRAFAETLNKATNTEFTIPQVEAILIGKTTLAGLDKAKVEELFNPHAKKLVGKILNGTDALELNQQFTKVLFTGGSSIVLKEHLKAAYEEQGYAVEFSKDPRFDNCKGALIKAING